LANRFSTYNNFPNLYTQEIVQIFTYMKTYQPNLIYIQVALKILDFPWSRFPHLKNILEHAL